MQWSMILFGTILLCHLIFYPLSPNPNSLAWFGNLAQWIGLLFGIIFIAKIARAASKQNFPKWLNLAFGVFILLLGQSLSTYSELLLKRSAYGSISDVFWILGFCIILIGLFQLAKNAARSQKEFIRWQIIGFALFLSVLAVLWSDLTSVARPTHLKVLDAFYALLEVWMAVLAFIMVLNTEQKLAWGLATISLTIYLMTDTFVVYYSDFQSAIYRYLDIPYFIGVCAWWLLGAKLETQDRQVQIA